MNDIRLRILDRLGFDIMDLEYKELNLNKQLSDQKKEIIKLIIKWWGNQPVKRTERSIIELKQQIKEV